MMLTIPMIALGACTSDIGSSQYTTRSVGQGGQASKCTVINVRQIRIASDSELGTLIGAGTGAVAGYTIGGGRTANTLGAIGGGLVGGAAGRAAQRGLTSQDGFEYVVELDNGRIVTTTQGNDVLMVPGDRCLFLTGQRNRVIPFNGR